MRIRGFLLLLATLAAAGAAAVALRDATPPGTANGAPTAVGSVAAGPSLPEGGSDGATGAEPMDPVMLRLIDEQLALSPAMFPPEEGAADEPATVVDSGVDGIDDDGDIALAVPGMLADYLASAPQSGAADGSADPDPVRPSEWERTVKVGRGDTLIELFMDHGLPLAEAHAAVGALRAVYNPRELRAGQSFVLKFRDDGDGERFAGLAFEPDLLRTITLEPNDDGDYVARQTKKAVTAGDRAARAVIRTSLFGAGAAAGVPRSVMLGVIRIFSHEIDFQRDLRPGDQMDVLFEADLTEDGEVVRTGELLYAALSLAEKAWIVYRFKTPGGRVDYFNPQGESIRKALLRTPIDGARMSSGYGMRRHPILGYGKMHRGVDFAAPNGTPIFAAGTGVITSIGRRGSYGNYIRLQHNTEISTAYAHLNGFAKGRRRGQTVKQGEVIGYVGTTGRSTGPHLHYEVLRHGRQVNPLSVDLPIGEKLANRELAAFHKHRKDIDRRFAAAMSGLTLAQFSTGAAPKAAAEQACAGAAGC